MNRIASCALLALTLLAPSCGGDEESEPTGAARETIEVVATDFAFGGTVVARDDTVPFEQVLFPPRAKPLAIRADILLADGRVVAEQAIAPACRGHSKGG